MPATGTVISGTGDAWVLATSEGIMVARAAHTPANTTVGSTVAYDGWRTEGETRYVRVVAQAPKRRREEGGKGKGKGKKATAAAAAAAETAAAPPTPAPPDVQAGPAPRTTEQLLLRQLRREAYEHLDARARLILEASDAVQDAHNCGAFSTSANDVIQWMCCQEWWRQFDVPPPLVGGFPRWPRMPSAQPVYVPPPPRGAAAGMTGKRSPFATPVCPRGDLELENTLFGIFIFLSAIFVCEKKQ
eukprot:TRINITY_DN9533_c0_g1_i1.p1 TRINITY_DN9533_c0_g1~~TRINITY_DN9533_c0_g1_i1.p1  ORF type:complete len:263 (+),score=54.77 TRINITY_DN9533_c0_g1_i1:57-791(+)